MISSSRFITQSVVFEGYKIKVYSSEMKNKKRAAMPVFLNNPDILQSSFRLPEYQKRTYLSEEAAPGLSLKIINSVKTTVRPVESGEIIMTTFRPG